MKKKIEMTKHDFLRLGQSVEGFTAVNPDSVPPGLTPVVLWDLWDMGVKFGQWVPKGIGFKTCDLMLEMYNFRQRGGSGSDGFTVGRVRESGIMDDGVFFFQLRNGMHIMWDKGFSVVEVQMVIKMTDEVAEAVGEKVGSTRTVLLEMLKEKPKIKVAEFFRDPNGVMPVMPDLDIDDVLADFDHPELLDYTIFGPLKLVCLKSEMTAIARDQEKKISILDRLGLTLDDVGDMPADRLIGLKRWVDQKAK